MKHPPRYPTLGQIRYAYLSQVLETHGDGGFSPELRLGIIRQAIRGLSLAQLHTARHHIENAIAAAHAARAAREA